MVFRVDERAGDPPTSQVEEGRLEDHFPWRWFCLVIVLVHPKGVETGGIGKGHFIMQRGLLNLAAQTCPALREFRKMLAFERFLIMMHQRAAPPVVEINATLLRLEIRLLQNTVGKKTQGQGVDHTRPKRFHEVQRQRPSLIGGGVKMAQRRIKPSRMTGAEQFAVEKGTDKGKARIHRIERRAQRPLLKRERIGQKSRPGRVKFDGRCSLNPSEDVHRIGTESSFRRRGESLPERLVDQAMVRIDPLDQSPLIGDFCGNEFPDNCGSEDGVTLPLILGQAHQASTRPGRLKGTEEATADCHQ